MDALWAMGTLRGLWDNGVFQKKCSQICVCQKEIVPSRTPTLPLGNPTSKVRSQNAVNTQERSHFFKNRFAPFVIQSYCSSVSKLPLNNRIVLQIDKIYLF